MPIGLDTTETYKYILIHDRGKPNPPAFIFHFLTSREEVQVERLCEDARKADTKERLVEICERAIRIGLVGWENVVGRDGADVPYDPSKLSDVLHRNDAASIALEYPEAGGVAWKERAGFFSQSPRPESASVSSVEQKDAA